MSTISRRLEVVLGIAGVAVCLAAPFGVEGCRTTDGDGPTRPELERPVKPRPCEDPACVGYCRQIGATGGTCIGDDCACDGCDVERCDGYCFWWDDGRRADRTACLDGSCACRACEAWCDETCPAAMVYAGWSAEYATTSVSECVGGRCDCACDDDACAEECAHRAASGACRGYECLCTCEDAFCNGSCRDPYGRGSGELRCIHHDPTVNDGLLYDALCECAVGE